MPVKSWTPPENGFIIRQQLPTDAQGKAAFEAQGKYCPSCYSVSKDLACLSINKPADMKENTLIQWEMYPNVLADAAERGCQFCAFMACRLFNDPGYMFSHGASTAEPVTGCCGASDGLTDKVREAIEHLRKCAHDNPDCYVRVYGERFDRDAPVKAGHSKIRWTSVGTNLSFEETRKLVGIRTELVVEFYATEEQGGSLEYLQTRPVNISPASEKGIEWAKARLNQCISDHQDCLSNPQSPLPDRILQIVDENNVAIVSGVDKTGQYATLSYCWGGQQAFATTKETYSIRKDGFSIKDLPKTIQDAITITRSLGQDKIWIDSLCIIQDSAEDKTIQISKMATYFHNSHITIAAARAKNSNSGFLEARGECKNHPGREIARDLLSMPFLCPNGQLAEVYFREENQYMLSDEPLSQRGWALQERIMSPRVLIYGTRVLWQCHTCQHSDGGDEDWSFDLRSVDNHRLNRQLAAATGSLARLNDSKKEHSAAEANEADSTLLSGSMDIWYRTVKEYSNCKLTLPEDKLLAISGMATKLAELSNSDYVAGLWRSDLLRGLLWSTSPNVGFRKPDKWRAPTWSWASIEGRVTYEHLPPSTAHACAEVVDCTVVPKSSASPYGEVSSGSLKIKGRLIELKDPRVAGKMLKREYGVSPLRDEDKGLAFRREMFNMLQSMNNEQDEGWHEPSNASLMVLFTHGEMEPGTDKYKDDKAQMAALVLTKREDGKYERIGSLYTVVLTGESEGREKQHVIEIV